MSNNVHPTAPGIVALSGFAALCEVMQRETPSLWTALAERLAGMAEQADVARLLAHLASGRIRPDTP